ncbi:hypothetical protein [Aquabacterium sp. OR-4]|nr:hypothetical protein [Aquabacterium sp. OR-4]MDT7836905.1 hypothetical protein [Aquabacterium sp. OR-4]
MRTTVAFATLAALLLSSQAHSSSSTCTREEAYAAEVVTDYLTTWDGVYRFYKQFKHCYEGAIAGGAEDKVQLLWANRWSEIPTMLALTTKDREFKKFIWVIIDSEAFPRDTFNTVHANVTRHCPKGAEEFCQAVRSAAKRRQ